MAKESKKVEDAVAAELEVLRDEWCWLVALGIGLIVVGAFAIGSAFTATMASVILFGAVMIVGGIAQVINAFRSPKWGGLFLNLLIGLLYLIVGAMVFESPVKASAALTLLMAVFFIIGGIFKIVVSLMERFPNWGWVLLSGVVSLMLGMIIKNNWEIASLTVIGIFVGIEFIGTGWSYVALGLTVRSVGEED